MLTFDLVLRAISRADRLRTAVAIVAAYTLLTTYLEQLADDRSLN